MSLKKMLFLIQILTFLVVKPGYDFDFDFFDIPPFKNPPKVQRIVQIVATNSKKGAAEIKEETEKTSPIYKKIRSEKSVSR